MTPLARRPPDLILLVAVFVLLVIGVVMVYSSSFIIGHNEFGDGNYFLVRHLSSVMLGLVVLGLLARMDYRRWQRWALPAVLVSVVLLGVVLVLGVESYG